MPAPAHVSLLVRWALQDHGLVPGEVTVHGQDRAGHFCEAWCAVAYSISVKFQTHGHPREHGQQVCRQIEQVLARLAWWT